MIAVAATGSVGPTIAPSTKQTGHERSSMNSCATTATITTVAITSPIESSEIARRLSLRSRRLAKNAPV